MTYGNSARMTGKFSNTGTRIRRKSRLTALSAACCWSFVIGGIVICITGSDLVNVLVEAYDSILRETSKIKKARMGHRATRQSQSCRIGNAHRSGTTKITWPTRLQGKPSNK